MLGNIVEINEVSKLIGIILRIIDIKINCLKFNIKYKHHNCSSKLFSANNFIIILTSLAIYKSSL